ncbi:hypothetical protein OUZ56_027479 [Daphnia magna]|uniref:Uncharacterized protein n=1 Tax=Daphnia magna TaxID=35525 RepID=A0ABQ9ZPW5_9CRUS|nr:hypothetical protein OUZ56_027479 [Daphnia magna]
MTTVSLESCQAQFSRQVRPFVRVRATSLTGTSEASTASAITLTSSTQDAINQELVIGDNQGFFLQQGID